MREVKISIVQENQHEVQQEAKYELTLPIKMRQMNKFGIKMYQCLNEKVFSDSAKLKFDLRRGA